MALRSVVVGVRALSHVARPRTCAPLTVRCMSLFNDPVRCSISAVCVLLARAVLSLASAHVFAAAWRYCGLCVVFALLGCVRAPWLCSERGPPQEQRRADDRRCARGQGERQGGCV